MFFIPFCYLYFCFFLVAHKDNYLSLWKERTRTQFNWKEWLIYERPLLKYGNEETKSPFNGLQVKWRILMDG